MARISPASRVYFRTLGCTLAKLRSDAKLSRAQLLMLMIQQGSSHTTGVTIYRWETGIHRIPVNDLAILARIYKVSVDALLPAS